MQKWECLVHRLSIQSLFERMPEGMTRPAEERIQGLGAEGWELVSIIPEVTGEIYTEVGPGLHPAHESVRGNIETPQAIWVFKRPVSDP